MKDFLYGRASLKTKAIDGAKFKVDSLKVFSSSLD